MAPYRDAAAAAAAIQKGRTAAVFVEPVQGEGGINPGARVCVCVCVHWRGEGLPLPP